MEIFTLNVGQGQFVVVTGNNEAIIVDTYLPLDPKEEIINIKAALAKILPGKALVGLVITGFDADHFNEIGLKIILNKYRPNWIMYPRYFKNTDNADNCFNVIDSFDKNNSINRYSVSLSDDNLRFYNNICNDFRFELFSPHKADMNSSNNCSIVLKVIEKSTGLSYLITGDTENLRWENIVKYFGNSIKANVLDAPHHGSKNGITESAMKLISPNIVLVSAGVNNKYGHPDKEAMDIFRKYSPKIYCTNSDNGQSIRSVLASTTSINSYLFQL